MTVQMIKQEMGRDLKNILFLPIHESAFQEFLVLARYMKSKTSYIPIFVLAYENMYRYRKDLQAEGIEYFLSGSVSSSDKSYLQSVKSFAKEMAFISKVIGIYRSLPPILFHQYRRFVKELSSNLTIAKEIIERYAPRAVFLSSDRYLGIEPALIRACRKNCIPTIIMSVAVSGWGDDAAYLRKNNPVLFVNNLLATSWNRQIARSYPQQVYHSRFGKLLFYPAPVIKALADFDMLPANPWNINGFSDFICVANPQEKKEYIEHGVPEGKIEVTGQLSYDELFFFNNAKSEIKDRLFSDYAFNKDKKLIICAVPHLFEHGSLPWRSHWRLTKLLVGVLVSVGQNLLLSLHPKSDIYKYLPLEKRYQCRIAKEPCRKIIAAADVFVATYSSTVQWANLCAVPAIVVDFYGFNYTLYDHLEGIVKVTKQADLAQVLKKMICDKDWYKLMQQRLREDSGYKDFFDGMVRERIIRFVQSLEVRGEKSHQ